MVVSIAAIRRPVSRRKRLCGIDVAVARNPGGGSRNVRSEGNSANFAFRVHREGALRGEMYRRRQHIAPEYDATRS